MLEINSTSDMSINAGEVTAVYTDHGAAEEDMGSETTLLLGNRAVEQRAKGASFTSSVFNLMNAIMGSGILGLAYAMAHTGVVGFCILLLLVSSLAAYSINLLLKLCDETGINTYEGLGGRALQKPGKVLVGVTILIQNIGAMSSYMFILKTELPAAISSFLSPETSGGAWYADGRTLLILVTVCVVLPLALLPRIGFLGYSSSLAFLFMLFFTVVVVVNKWAIPCPLPSNVTHNQISNTTESDCTPKLFVISSKSAYTIPTMSFSFLCHTAVLPIYSELDRPTRKRMQNVTNVSISLSSLLYLISALFGYLTFYGHVDTELLLGYNAYLPRDVLVMTVRLAVLLAVVLTVPLIHFPARKAIIMLFCGDGAFSWVHHIFSTLLILAVVMVLAIFVPDIRNVFGVVGSTTSTCLLFVFPGMFYLRLSNQPLRSLESIGAVSLMVFGLFVGLLSLSVIVVTWVQNP
ncbi:probable sodium-coupled neutral amino acid transporter 6 [Esox lucius]|uniref:Amino acid transporter transmembrane domain-containing protein n=1 Tax=Esox lucius TaxID=8010 RepID=A0AAY5K357_ESOLU|nr:probable sodium-coupled neutral amino acid transporter 6 [Esox lucius]